MKLFSSGSELGSFVVASELPRLSWNAILELSMETPSGQSSSLSLRFRIFRESKRTIIAFVTSPALTPHQLQQDAGLVSSSSSTAKEGFALFESLCSKTVFAINRASITLFHRHLPQLTQLKNEIDYSKPLIITGVSLGGSIACLFTLWLLESGKFLKGKSVCITFGSPLIGDIALQKALIQFKWNSHFLHVVSDQDPLPRVFVKWNSAAETTSPESVHKPFGTFLLCSESGCSCFEDPESILELLLATASPVAANQDPDLGICSFDYGPIMEHLKKKALCKDNSEAELATSPFTAGIITQLFAIGITSPQPQHQQEQNIDINDLAERLEKQEKKFLMGKNKGFNSSKKLNENKIFMTYLEWYKKSCKDKGIGYYDSYKKKLYRSDMDVDEFCKRLTNYWIDEVEEAEKKPQKEGAFLRMGWLFGGTNYRRMIEPLYIAKYYHEKGGKDYEHEGRPRHFKLLEEWLKQYLEKKERRESSPNDGKRQKVAASLTEDSCFWAKVEEAIISCELLKKEGSSSAEEKESLKQKLKEFENYVCGLLKNRAVSTEIFLERSSYMHWWKDYEETMESSYASQLTNFMKNRRYEEYSSGSGNLRL